MNKMKKKCLWMLAVILSCGLLWTSCSNEDNPPVDPGTDVLNAELTGVWYEEINAEGTVYDGDGSQGEPLKHTSVMNVAVFHEDGTGHLYKYFFNDEDKDKVANYLTSWDEEENGKFHYTSTADGLVHLELDDKLNKYFPLTLDFIYTNGHLAFEENESSSIPALGSRRLTRGDHTLEAMMGEWKALSGESGGGGITPDDLKDVTYTILETGVQSIVELAKRAFGKEDDQFAKIAGDAYNGIQQSAGSNALNIKIPTFYFRYFNYSYESVDATGKPVTLSARVSWGGNMLFNYFYEARPCYIILSPHFTITTDKSSPTSGNAYEIPFMSGNLLLIQPDYQGFGITKDMDQAYINHEVCAQQCIDALKAGYKLFSEQANVIMESDWKLYVAGCSQGGGNTLACHKWLDTHEDFAKAWRFEYSYSGSGPHSPRITFQKYFDQKGIIFPVVFPVVIRSMKMSYPDILGKYEEEEFFSDKYNTIKPQIDQMVASKEYSSDQINQVIFDNFPTTVDDDGNKTVALADLLSENTMDMNSDMTKALFECLDKNDLTTGWTPIHPIYLFHGKRDLIVPYANAEAVQTAFPDKVTLYTERFGYDDHLSSCAQFLVHIALADW